MKLWGTVRKNNEIIRQHTIEYAGLTRGMAEGWDELIGPLCHVVRRRTEAYSAETCGVVGSRNYARTVLNTVRVEPVDFDKFEIEIFYPKKK